MTIKKLHKLEIIISLLGCIYASILILKNPQPFGEIALFASIVFFLFSFIKKAIIRKSLQGLALAAVLLFSILGTRSLMFNISNEELLESPTKVQFFKSTFKASLEKAKSENKFVFIDFYTVWCGPCIEFHKNVLSNNEVAKYMNNTFVNTKYNLYKGEGIKLREIYNVNYVPRFLIIDTEGNIVEDISTDSIVTAQRMIKITKNYTK